MNKIIGLIVLGMMSLPGFAAVNVNTASQSELESISGLGPAKAKAIIIYREANGSFKSVDDLDKVKGFGKATIEKLRGDLTVGKDGQEKKQ
jgi:competence protein ComEA